MAPFDAVDGPVGESRGAESRSAALAEVASTDRSPEIGPAAACSASNSPGGRSPSASCSRLWLNQPTYSTTASSSCERVRQTRSAISSVLKLSTNDSAIALS